MRKTYGTKFINVMLLLALIILTAGAIISYQQVQHLILTNSWVIHTHQVLEATQATSFAVSHLETRAHNHIVTSDPKIYQEYLQSIKNYQKSMGKLVALTRDNPIQTANIRFLEKLISQYITSLDYSLILYQKQGKQAALAPQLRIIEEEERSRITQMLNAINQKELELLSQRNIDLQKSTQLSNLTVLAMGIAGIAMVLISFILLNYSQGKRIRAEREREEIESQLKKIIDGSSDLIAAVDMQETLIAFNKAYEKLIKKLFGKTIKVGTKLETIFADYPKKQEIIGYWQRALIGEEFNVDMNFATEKKPNHYYEATYSIMRDANGEQIGAAQIMRDITERHKVDQLKNEFISVVSHELRTPLTSIKGSIGLLISGAISDMDPKILNLLSIAYNNSERLIALINDILDIEKIEAGHMEMQFNVVDLSELLAEGISVNKTSAQKYNVKLKFEDIGYRFEVFADHSRLMQVLNNLISNAIKFSPTSGEVEIKLSAENGRGRVSVIDHGVGIPEEFQNQIFQRFSQADSSAVRKYGGSGLGLSISKLIMERMGGKINFMSQEGVGSTFYFELPLVSQPYKKDRKVKNLPQNSISADKTGQYKILYVEDDNDLSEIVENLLLKDAKVIKALNKKQALDEISRQKFDLVLLDLILPDGSGLDLLPVLKNLDIPVIIFSSQELPKKYVPFVTSTLVKSKTNNQKLIEAVQQVLHARSSSHA